MLTNELDRATQILEWAAYACFVMGNSTTGHYELIETDGTWPEARITELYGRGLRFLGVLGVGMSGTKAAFDEPLEEAAVSVLAEKFLRMYLSKRVEEFTYAVPQLKDAGAAYLERLFNLPDPRTAN